MPQGVIFDVDGTIIDSVDEHARAWQEAFAHFGHDVPFEAIRAQIGKGGDQLMPVFLSGDELQRFGKELNGYRAHLFKRKYLEGLCAFPCVRPLFQRITTHGMRIALASSAKADELETYKQKAQVADLLEAETSSDDAERSKPHPDIFKAALDRLGLPATEAIVVGDSPYDAEAAAKLGLAIVGVLCGGFPEADLRKAGCVAIYADPADLLRRCEDSPLVRC
ncbi:MAG: HAD family hydrolase [Acetobacteraceae bacterium]|nr:HAD family hydrolase [Acetobacteraceae bacterium]